MANGEDVVETKRRPAGLDGRGAGRRDGFVRTGAGADGAGSGATVRGRRVIGIAAGWGDGVTAGTVAPGGAAVAAATGGATATGAAVPAPGAASTALRPRRVLWPGDGVRRRHHFAMVSVAAAGPYRSWYAKMVHVDNALLDRRQPRYGRVPLHRATAARRPARRPVRHRRRWGGRRPVPQVLGGRRRPFVQTRVNRVRLTFVPGTAAFVPRSMTLVVHVNRIDPVTAGSINTVFRLLIVRYTKPPVSCRS